ncbi:DUF4158 domain-containing protein [Streptosporangium sp. CA-135522]|uniref:DUF4158 domain-containing protein n=1 Tax=Streptosporangium sp. CA-135522 TaxID=3240072 RepID=UPI003D8EEFBD
MTSIERTAYPQFKRLTSARVLHVFFTPTAEESAWAQERTSSPQALFALVLALKCFQKMARFPNALDLMDVVRTLVAEGWPITAEELGALSSYLRAHISRFGAYATDEIGVQPAAFNPELKEVDFTVLNLAA